MEREGAESNRAQIDDLRDGEFQPANSGKGRDALVVKESAVGVIAAAEIDQAVATAHKFPRSLALFRKEVMDMAGLNETVAAECLFALSRDGKVIEGPSVRMAEIIASCWRNCRVGSRIMHEGAETVTAQGLFYDCERNVGSQSEVARRIVNKAGRRYGVDMIVTTTNAAQAIAKRNAITAGVPRALWWDIYQRVRAIAAGDAKSLATKRADAVKAFQIYGIKEEQILTELNRAGMEEVTRDDLVLLYGILTAIKDGETTPEDAFPPKPADISTLRTRADEGKKDPAQTVTDASAGDQGAVGEPAVRQAEPTAEQRAAQAAHLAAKAAVASDTLLSDAAKVTGELPPEEEKKPPAVKRTRAAQKELD